jgi:hypothetical protein
MILTGVCPERWRVVDTKASAEPDACLNGHNSNSINGEGNDRGRRECGTVSQELP